MNVATRILRDRVLILAVAGGLAYWFVVAAAYHRVGYSILTCDTRSYADWSHDLIHGGTIDHLPGYPATVAAARVLTAGLLGDEVLMPLLSFCFWIGAIIYVRRLLTALAPAAVVVGLLLFALSPEAGPSCILMAHSDPLYRVLLLGAFWYAVSREWGRWAVCVGLCLMVNKFAWPNLFLLTLVCLWQYRLPWRYVLAACLPIGTYCIAMAIHYRDAIWILRPHYHLHLMPKAGFPLLDGVLGTFARGGMAMSFKGALLLSTLLVSILLTLWLLPHRKWLLLVMTVPGIAYGVLLNRTEALSIVRFADMLVVPFCAWLATRPRLLAVVQSKPFLAAAGVVLLAYQFAWSAYVVSWQRKTHPETATATCLFDDPASQSAAKAAFENFRCRIPLTSQTPVSLDKAGGTNENRFLAGSGRVTGVPSNHESGIFLTGGHFG